MDCGYYHEALSINTFQRNLVSMPAQSVICPAGYALSPDAALMGFDQDQYCLQPTLQGSWSWFYGISLALLLFVLLSTIFLLSPSRGLEKLSDLLRKLDYRPTIRQKCPDVGQPLSQNKSAAGGIAALVLIVVCFIGCGFYVIANMDPLLNPVPQYSVPSDQQSLASSRDSSTILQLTVVLVDRLQNASLYDHWSLCDAAHVPQYASFSHNNQPMAMLNHSQRAYYVSYHANPLVNLNITHSFRACTLRASVEIPPSSSIQETDQFHIEVTDVERVLCGSDKSRCPLMIPYNQSGQASFHLNTLTWTSFSTNNDTELPNLSQLTPVSLMGGDASIPTLPYSDAMKTTQICCRTTGSVPRSLSLVSFIKQRAAPSTIALLIGSRVSALRGYSWGSLDSASDGQNGIDSRLSLKFGYAGTTIDLGEPGGSVTQLMTQIVSLVGGAIGAQLLLRWFFTKVSDVLTLQKWRIGGVQSCIFGTITGFCLPLIGQFLGLLWSRSLRFTLFSTLALDLWLIGIGISYFMTWSLVPVFMRGYEPWIYAVACYILVCSLGYCFLVISEYRKLLIFFKQELKPNGVLYKDKDSDGVRTMGEALLLMHKLRSGPPHHVLSSFALSLFLPGVGFMLSEYLAISLAWTLGALLWLALLLMLLGGYIMFLMVNRLGMEYAGFVHVTSSLALLSIGLYLLLIFIVHLIRVLNKWKHRSIQIDQSPLV